jgi:ferritin-like metal-binding protein YciE
VTSLQNLDDLFVDELRDIYNAEQQLLKALPQMRKKASSQRLSDALNEHLRVTEQQVDRLEQVFKELDRPARGKKCKGMEGLIEEGKEVLEADGDSDTLDAAIIGAAQRVEHYEIAAYGTAGDGAHERSAIARGDARRGEGSRPRAQRNRGKWVERSGHCRRADERRDDQRRQRALWQRPLATQHEEHNPRPAQGDEAPLMRSGRMPRRAPAAVPGRRRVAPPA